MDKISEQLIQLSDTLDKAGKTKCANAVDELIEHKSLMKVAQYVGVIGYVLKQNRAMGNCIRKNRVSSTASMQEVVLGCLSEYQDGQQYDNNEWTSKYAQVVKQFPDQFASSHVDFLEALAKENNMEQHIARVKKAQTVLSQESIQNELMDQVAFDLESLESVLKEGDAAQRPFKVAAPPSGRGNWSRFWSPSWTRRGTDKDTQFEMDAVIESLMNIQGNVQQIRSGISQLSYQSRAMPEVQQFIQSLSDTSWEKTTKGIHALKQELSNRWMDDAETVGELGKSHQQIEGNINQIFAEIKEVQDNMYNLRLRDPVKGRGSLKSATEEYGDLARALDRLYINPLDERALHYSLKLHGRLEDTLNERAGAQDPGYNEWVNAPGSELGMGRNFPGTPSNDPGANVAPGVGSPLRPSPETEDALQRMTSDKNVLAMFLKFLSHAAIQSKSKVSGEAVQELRGMFQEKQHNLKNNPPQASEQFQAPGQPQTPGQFQAPGQTQAPEQTKPVQTALEKLNAGADLLSLYPQVRKTNQSTTSSTLKKLTKIADVLNDWNGDLAELLREYIADEEDRLPEFPSMSSIIKEHEASRRKITQKKAGKAVLST